MLRAKWIVRLSLAMTGITAGNLLFIEHGVAPVHSSHDRWQIATRSLLYDLISKPGPLTLGAGDAAIDTHVHTRFSHDSDASVAEDIRQAARRGLSGIAITDHNTMDGVPVAEASVRTLVGAGEIPPTFFIIPGEEITSSQGHIIGLFLRKPVLSGLSPAETVRRIHAQGGFADAVHPTERHGLGDLANTLPFDGVETDDAGDELIGMVSSRASRALRSAFNRAVRKPRLGGSDSHEPKLVGMSYTLLPGCARTPEAVRRALFAGDTVPSVATGGAPPQRSHETARTAHEKPEVVLATRRG